MSYFNLVKPGGGEDVAKFAMAFHCYQPVFNFDGEIEKAYKSAYLPLLKTIEKFPNIKACFHFSGNIIEWLEKNHPDYIGNVKKLVDKSQIELIGGGYFEPVMALIPEYDRLGQIRMNEEIIFRVFGVRPRGVWIAERVWEPSLADTLRTSGIEYTIIDDYHILLSGARKERIFSPCRIQGNDGNVRLFPCLTNLRYAIPFCPPNNTIEYMREICTSIRSKDVCFFFADDGEKFGAWPHTYKWVYKRKWLEKFFLLLTDNSGWLESSTYSGIMDTVPAQEVPDIPESSYPEMMRWSGGNFKNFLKKYPEAGRMHKRMIFVSGELSAVNSNADRADMQKAKEELFKAQAGCAYWHGTFGGVYLPHLRQGVYEHLIKAQTILDKNSETNKKNGECGISDYDFKDSSKETVFKNSFIDLFVCPSEGGAISELDYKPLNVNLMNTFSRAREVYHDKLFSSCSAKVRQARKIIRKGGISDIHYVLGIGERGLKKLLCYDDYRRFSFLTHIFRNNDSWNKMAKNRASHDGFLKKTYTSKIYKKDEGIFCVLSRRDKAFIDNGRSFDLDVFKEVEFSSASEVVFTHKISERSGGEVFLSYAVEFNFLIWDESVKSGERCITGDFFTLEDKYSRVRIDFYFNRRFNIFTYPVYTVNETETGLRKMFQGVSVLIGEKTKLDCGQDLNELKIKIVISSQ